MRRFGWVVGLGPPLLLAAGAVLAPQNLVAGAAKIGCPAGFAANRGADMRATVQLGTTLGSKGEVTGRRLVITASGTSRAVSLAAEAFAAQSVANVVIYGQNDPASGSTVRAVDLQTGCDYALWQSPDVIRSALITPDLRSLYVHTVSQSSRTDLGVARIDLETRAATAVLEPLTSDAEHGPTFATLLRWSLDGDGLAVQSCGIARCRMRVLDRSTGGVTTFAGNQGPLVGLTAHGIATFAACTGLPCPLKWIDRSTARASDVDVDAFGASLDEDALGPVLIVSTPAGTKEIRP